MRTPILPLICGVAVAAMSAAGISHWWSVRQFVAALGPEISVSQPPRSTPPVPAPAVTADTKSLQTPAKQTLAQNPPAAAPDPHQKHFFESLVSRMEGLQNQNRDLLDQLAETNRDVMKLQFRVDTHSESFRPLPVSEDRPFTSLDEEIGVLPPRAEPVLAPSQE
jgi:hypothetical protein